MLLPLLQICIDALVLYVVGDGGVDIGQLQRGVAQSEAFCRGPGKKFIPPARTTVAGWQAHSTGRVPSAHDAVGEACITRGRDDPAPTIIVQLQQPAHGPGAGEYVRLDAGLLRILAHCHR